MQPVTQTHPVSKKALWTGYIMSAIPVLMLIFSAVMKFAKPPPVLEGFKHLGLPENLAFGLGVLELGCTLLYLIPSTSVLGAILLTGYLGGAVATHVRIGSPLFSHVLFPIYVSALIWGGIYLREWRLRALVPLRQSAP